MMPDAIVLCGGAGLRLRSVTGSEAPKAMAPVAGRPFMELLLLQLKRYGFSRVILSVGYQQDVIRGHFGQSAFGLELVYSPESSPLGTGGALGQAAHLVTTDDALVMNGDSYTDIDLCRLVLMHRKDQAGLTVTLVAGTLADAGSVLVGDKGKITTFAEKCFVQGARYRSAGIYMVGKHLLARIPQGQQVSLEQQLFPTWIDEGRDIRGFIHEGTCVDIGTPERYQGAQAILAHAEMHGFAMRTDGQL
jgi:D-glycero-alpha-D-manno-heptose 1-phosphate guanylyltransferase